MRSSSFYSKTWITIINDFRTPRILPKPNNTMKTVDSEISEIGSKKFVSWYVEGESREVTAQDAIEVIRYVAGEEKFQSPVDK